MPVTVPDNRRLMMVELNEIDPSFLRDVSARLGLRNLPRLLALPHTHTTTDDVREYHGLDPWVQWVNVHSGVPSTVHGILKLGVTRPQVRPQIWHALARAGHSWGVWGAMNAPLGDRTGCRFFLPDPWSYDEVAYPDQLNDLLALPRYVAQNYLDIDKGRALRGALRFVRFALRPSNLGVSARFAAKAIGALVRAGVRINTFTTLLDYLSALEFVQLRRRERPDFSLIFLNHIAHLQHECWRGGAVLHRDMELGVRLCDAIIGTLLDDRAPGEALLVLNAFKQTNVAGQGVYCYRQLNPAAALESFGIRGARLEPCMTNDAHVLLGSVEEADRAQEVLAAATLSDGTRAFHVERPEPTRLFYQIDFHHRVDPAATIRTAGGEHAFGTMFHAAERTGAHVNEGDVFADGIAVRDGMHNHEIFDAVLRYFDVAASTGEGNTTAPVRAREHVAAP